MLLALRPGVGLGPFLLGQALPEVLTFLQQHKADFRCVEIKYSDKDTLRKDIVVGLPEHGFQLLFEPRSQRLRLVEVVDTTRLQMLYGRSVVFGGGGASSAPTFGRIYEAFGPTYPGEPDAEVSGYYPLQYPGIMLLFPSPLLPAAPAAGQLSEAGSGGGGRTAPSFPVPLGMVAERIYIHAGSRGPAATVLAAPPPPLEPGSQYMDPLEAVPCQGLYFGPGGAAAVRFGDAPQDVVSQLGQPARVVRKAGGPGAGGGDYFYCYPPRGLDLLFCGASHRLAKAVLHTNLPGHPSFNASCKANFKVHPSGWRPPCAWQRLHSSATGGAGSSEDLLTGSGAAGRSVDSEGGPAVLEAPTSASAAAAADAAAGRPAAFNAGVGPDAEGSANSSGAAPVPPSQRPAGGEEGAAAGEKAGGGLSAAYHMLVGLIDDVITLDPQKIAPEEGGGSGGAEGSEGPQQAEVEAAGEKKPPAAAPAPAGPAGKPPKPPSAAAATAPPPAPVSVKGGKKGKKSKKKRAAAAAAAAAAAGEQQEESDSMADVSASDSGFDSSSLGSSPHLTSHYIGPGRRRLGLGGGGSDWGSTADLAAKEGSVGCGSALDGWSDADDLFPLIAGEDEGGRGGGSSVGAKSVGASPTAAAAAAAAATAAAADEEEAAVGFEGADASLASWAVPPARASSALTTALSVGGTVSTAVQTADAGVGGSEGEGGWLGGGPPLLADLDRDGSSAWALESDSPQGYIIAAAPPLVDEGAAAEYERVPRQRDCSTQTPSHLLAPPRAPAGGGGGSGSPRVDTAGAAVAITADSRLEDIEAAFGHRGGPALHNRLGCSHPFGPSFLYAYQGVVFEVLQNGLIAAVTLFKP